MPDPLILIVSVVAAAALVIIIKLAVTYTHHYMQTMHSEETCEHRIECPAALATLAKKTPDAESVTYGDGTLGIEIDGKLWAAEVPHSEFRPGKRLPHEVWQYIKLATGENGDTYSR